MLFPPNPGGAGAEQRELKGGVPLKPISLSLSLLSSFLSLSVRVETERDSLRDTSSLNLAARNPLLAYASLLNLEGFEFTREFVYPISPIPFTHYFLMSPTLSKSQNSPSLPQLL